MKPDFASIVARTCIVASACLFAGGGAGCSAADPGLEAPRLLAAEKMVGALHVSWVNPPVGCDVIEIERRSAGSDGHTAADFAVLYTVPGPADNKHDATATDDLTYTYRLRCQKTGRYSGYS